MKKITLNVNGRRRTANVEDNEILLDVLRDTLGVKSVKAACWRGECGLCSVLMYGKAVKSCLILAVEADGAKITTVEGLSRGESLSPLQKSFVEHGAMQCGFCTPAFVLTAHSLLTTNPTATDSEIKEYMSGLICRCGTYNQMLPAIKEAAKHYRKHASDDL
ncbi:MAG: (2Fe-2S)-binding protein [Nitrososphaerota archaeon]|jgi:carbon-monoxide dehydrogenase small subunit|nr:(2Fe-2S)-binding protein [Nitrososphaerota archaeon]